MNPIPSDYPVISPYLCIKGAAAAIDFYKQAFGATERTRMAAPDGTVMHAEMMIGDGLFMLADEFPEMGFRSSQTLGGSPVTVHVYVADVDALVAQAVAAGAKLARPVQNQFYGDRTASLTDPFGHVWYFATRVEDVAPDEMKRRSEAMMQQPPAAAPQ